MDKFYALALAPWLLLLMRAFAIPVQRLVERRMRDGRVKRLLLRRFGTE